MFILLYLNNQEHFKEIFQLRFEERDIKYKVNWNQNQYCNVFDIGVE